MDFPRFKRMSTAALITILAVCCLISLYVFSRFTVDDAFISWRYGKNLVDFGVWNYNPTMLDATQAYTNPIFAVLAILPNYIGIDVVLFFKLTSTLTLIAFLLWIYKATHGAIILPLALVGLPATVAHIYGGLETFWFVILVATLLIALYEARVKYAVAISILLFFVRPETWLFVFLVPLYFFINEPQTSLRNVFLAPAQYFKNFRFRPLSGAGVLLALSIPLLLYFAFHKVHFGSALPNTFYVKSGAPLSIANLVKFSFFLLPIACLLILSRLKLAFFMAAFFGAMVLSYSTSNLQMDYAGRFSFHIFAPIYIFFCWLAARTNGRFLISTDAQPTQLIRLRFQTAINLMCLLFLGCFALISDNTSAHLSTYYPRALLSHAELGKTLNLISEKYKIRSFAIGDAGMAAYHSKINSLDSIGLGSGAVARGGVSGQLLDLYGIDVVAFHARPEKILLEDRHQQTIYDWAVSQGFIELCDIYWQKDYTLRIFSRKPIEEVSQICKSSFSANSRSNRQMLADNIITPPWSFWRE